MKLASHLAAALPGLVFKVVAWSFVPLLLSPAAGAGAGAGPAPSATVRGTWFLSVDNDLFNRSDDHYTSGVQLGWVSGYLENYAQAPVPGLLVPLLRTLPREERQGHGLTCDNGVSVAFTRRQRRTNWRTVAGCPRSPFSASAAGPAPAGILSTVKP